MSVNGVFSYSLENKKKIELWWSINKVMKNNVLVFVAFIIVL